MGRSVALMKLLIVLFAASLLNVSSGVFAQSAPVPVSFFLKVDGIDGDAQDSDHNGEIALVSFHAGVSQRALQTYAGSGASATKSDFSPIKVFKFVDKASAKLFLACATGQVIKNVV